MAQAYLQSAKKLQPDMYLKPLNETQLGFEKLITLLKPHYELRIAEAYLFTKDTPSA